MIKDARAKSCVAAKPGQEFTLPRRKPYPGRRVSCPGEHGRSMLSHKSSGNSKRVEKKSNALPSPVINSTFVKHGWKRVPPPRKTKRPIPRKRNGHERKGLYARFFRPLSLSLSFRSSRDSNLTRIHPLLSNSIVSSFARSLVRSFARFLNLVKRDWKLCSFVGALQRLAAGNSARQILRTRNWLDSISKGWGRKGRGGASSRVVK